jgi:hypothetical protein
LSPAYQEMIGHARHPSRPVAHRAIRVLATLTHPAVRALADALLSEGNSDGSGLLVRNYQAGDYERLAHLMRTWTDAQALHDLGYALRDLAMAHPDPAAVPTLLLQYEYGPCSLCRKYTVKALQRLAAAPMWLLEECQHDAADSLREIARQALAGR